MELLLGQCEMQQMQQDMSSDVQLEYLLEMFSLTPVLQPLRLESIIILWMGKYELDYV